MSHYSAISWRKQAILNEMTIHYLLSTRSTLLDLYSASSLKHHSETLTWIWANQSCSCSLMLCVKWSSTYQFDSLWFDSTRSQTHYLLHKPLYQRCVSILAHWNNSLRIDTSPHSDILSRFKANQSLLSPYCCVLSREATYTHFLVFGLTRRAHEPTIYHSKQAP